METAVNLSRLRESLEWDEVIRPILKERHAAIASQLARAAAKGDLNGLQLASGRLLEVEGLLGLSDLLREIEESENDTTETEDDGRGRDSGFIGWGRRWIRGNRERERTAR